MKSDVKYIVLGHVEYMYGDKNVVNSVQRHDTIEDAQVEQTFLIKRYPSEHFVIFEEVSKDGLVSYNELNTPPPLPLN